LIEFIIEHRIHGVAARTIFATPIFIWRRAAPHARKGKIS
jgi:hypothetical protein